jgi:hypothetical protein
VVERDWLIESGVRPMQGWRFAHAHSVRLPSWPLASPDKGRGAALKTPAVCTCGARLRPANDSGRRLVVERVAGARTRAIAVAGMDVFRRRKRSASRRLSGPTSGFADPASCPAKNGGGNRYVIL